MIATSAIIQGWIYYTQIAGLGQIMREIIHFAVRANSEMGVSSIILVLIEGTYHGWVRYMVNHYCIWWCGFVGVSSQIASNVYNI